MKKIAFAAMVLFFIVVSFNTKPTVGVVHVKKEINYIPYYLKVYEADSLLLIGDYEKSFKILDDLFKVYEPINMDGYYECGTYLVSAYMTNHKDNISQKVKEYYLKFGELHVQSDKESNHRAEMLKFSQITKREVDSLRGTYLKNINYKLRGKIVQMMADDQYYRVTEFNYLKMDSVSKAQFPVLIEIFKTYGFPSKEVIGYDGLIDHERPATVEAIMLHLSTENKNQILPLLMSYVKNGTCTPDVYASVYDKNMWFLQNKQYYGSFLGDLPLVDENNINTIRKSIGLPSLYYNQWREKFLY